MLYPTTYREELAKITEGEYGGDLQQLFNTTLLAAINARTVVYLCSVCGKWEEGIDMTLWAQNDPKKISPLS